MILLFLPSNILRGNTSNTSQCTCSTMAPFTLHFCQLGRVCGRAYCRGDRPGNPPTPRFTPAAISYPPSSLVSLIPLLSARLRPHLAGLPVRQGRNNPFPTWDSKSTERPSFPQADVPDVLVANANFAVRSSIVGYTTKVGEPERVARTSEGGNPKAERANGPRLKCGPEFARVSQRREVQGVPESERKGDNLDGWVLLGTMVLDEAFLHKQPVFALSLTNSAANTWQSRRYPHRSDGAVIHRCRL